MMGVSDEEMARFMTPGEIKEMREYLAKKKGNE
jgi:hypothetical protein